MRIRVNGREEDLPDGATVADLIARLGLHPRRIAVERNQRLVRRTEYTDTPLSAGDVLEIVTLVGGG